MSSGRSILQALNAPAVPRSAEDEAALQAYQQMILSPDPQYAGNGTSLLGQQTAKMLNMLGMEGGEGSLSDPAKANTDYGTAAYNTLPWLNPAAWGQWGLDQAKGTYDSYDRMMSGNPEPLDGLAVGGALMGIGGASRVAGLGADAGGVGAMGAGKTLSSDLPMDQASQLARAKEMGFDTSKVYYNGSAVKPDEFDMAQANQHFGHQDGVGAAWFTPSEKRAAWYAEKHAARSNDKALRSAQREADAGNASKWPWQKKVDTSIPDQVNGSGYTGAYYIKPGKQISGDVSGEVSMPELMRRASDGGYETALAKNHQDTPEMVNGVETYLDELAVFDPRNIRSVNAAFDPAKSDSANLLASNSDQAGGFGAGLADLPDNDLRKLYLKAAEALRISQQQF